MRIFDLTLKNIGPFNDSFLKFRDVDEKGSSVTIITGMNGTGKSIIVDAIRTLLLGIYSYKLERNVIRDRDNFYIGANLFDGQRNYLLESDELNNDGAIKPNDAELGVHIYYEFRIKPTWILDYWSSSVNRDTYKISSIQSIIPKSYLVDSLVGNKPNADLVKLITFFDYLKGSEDRYERELGKYLYEITVEIINPCLVNANFSHISRSTLEPIIKTENSEITFEKLSVGNSFLIQKLLSLLSQAYSVYRLNGGKVKEICNVNGLLLIDEAENHLHPRLQKILLQNVLHFFPNLQIILTTHSPFLVSSVQSAKVFVTKSVGDHSIIEDATDYYANKPVEEILRTSLFETDSFNQDISSLLKARKKAMHKNDEVEVKRIEEDLIKKNPEYFKYLNIDNL